MRKLQNSSALCLPDVSEHAVLRHCIASARSGEVKVRVIIGIGETNSRIPLRVLGYAKAISEAIRVDVPTLINQCTVQVHLFSSATKIAFLSGSSEFVGVGKRAVKPLVTLAEALRITGYRGPISIDVADPRAEVPSNIERRVSIPAKLQTDLLQFELNNNNGANSRLYGIEHAAMFEDLGDRGDGHLRIFVGGKPEGVFWAIRRSVRTAAVACGAHVNPTLGLVLYGLKRPWYHALDGEPLIDDFTGASLEDARLKLEAVGRVHHQLKRENDRAARLLDSPELHELVRSMVSLSDLMKFAEARQYKFCPRILKLIETQ